MQNTLSKKFKVDYDPEGDTLFMHDARRKSTGAIEIEHIIFDMSKDGQIVGIEILQASKDLAEAMDIPRKDAREILSSLKDTCRIEIRSRNNWVMVRWFLPTEKMAEIKREVYMPMIKESSPAIR